jgi:hypothetical protein
LHDLSVAYRGAARQDRADAEIGDVICVCLVAGYRGRPVQLGRPPVRIRRIAVSAAFAAGLAALPLATAKAQYYPPCSPFPLFWPFCVAGAIVGTAATIVTAPFVALTAPPYSYGYYGRPYYSPPPYYAPGYYAPPYYYGPR